MSTRRPPAVHHRVLLKHRAVSGHRAGVSWWQRANAGAELETFLDTLSILVDSGMGIVPALDAIGEELHAAALRAAITQMRNDIESGLPFWRALETSQLVSDQTIALLRLGEESGQLPQNLAVVVGQQRKEREFQSKVRSALIYPSLVFSLTLAIGLGIAWFLLPKLATVFSQLHLKLPLLTRVMIAIGAFLSHYGIVAVPLGLVFWLVW